MCKKYNKPYGKGDRLQKSVAVMSQHTPLLPTEAALLNSHTALFCARARTLSLSFVLYFLPVNRIYIQTITNKQTPTGLPQNFEKFESIKESGKKHGSISSSFDLNSPEKNKK